MPAVGPRVRGLDRQLVAPVHLLQGLEAAPGEDTDGRGGGIKAVSEGGGDCTKYHFEGRYNSVLRKLSNLSSLVIRVRKWEPEPLLLGCVGYFLGAPVPHPRP